jgi:hypothetical protein
VTKKRLIVGAIVMAGVFGACSADATDFAEEAEKFIKNDLEEQGVADVEVDCVEPPNTDKNTSFDCTATAPDGQSLAYTATITDKNTVSIAATGAGAPTDEAPVEEEPVEEVEEEIEEEG